MSKTIETLLQERIILFRNKMQPGDKKSCLKCHLVAGKSKPESSNNDDGDKDATYGAGDEHIIRKCRGFTFVNKNNKLYLRVNEDSECMLER